MFQEYSREIKKLLKGGLVLIVILALFLAILSISAIKEYAHIGDGVYPSTTISVSGTGEVYAMPDIAQFSFTVTEEADSIAEAQQTVTEKIDSAIEILNAEGVEDNEWVRCPSMQVCINLNR